MGVEVFTHLHVHSQYSLLEGALKFPALISQSKEFGMQSLALTDSGNLFGAVEFYEKAKAAEIKPIIGAEIYYQSEGSYLQKDNRSKNLWANLILLAMDQEGYKNICRLLALAHMEGFYYRPRVDKDLLLKHKEGLIALSGTMQGEIHKALAKKETHVAVNALADLKVIYGDRLYLEIQDHNLVQERKIRQDLIDFSKEHHVPLVASNDCKYLLPSHQTAHQVLHCIQLGRTLREDEERAIFVTDQMYFKSPEDMQESFADLPEALKNTQIISEHCNFKFNFDTYYFPKFEPPNQMSIEDYLIQAAKEGFEKRWQVIAPLYSESLRAEKLQEYKDRMETEIKIILDMGFAAYFIIVSDFIKWAKNNDIPVGPGRGSAAGSLVAYCLEITDLDPIPFDLLFERFLNPERISMPDVDVDFCMNRREEVIRYVSEKYGHVSQIITFGTLKAKAVVRDVGRVLDMPYSEVDKLAKLIPNQLNITLKEALESEPKLKELVDQDPQISQLMGIARTLEGITRHASTHAAGVVIGDRPLTEFLPLYRGSNDETVCQYEMKSVEKIGLVKFDFLGLKTLTILDEARKNIERVNHIQFRLEGIPLDDEEVYQQLSSGDGLAIFQLESSGMRDLLTKLKPSCFEDLIALVALYRPGPLGSGMVDDFIDRKHGRKKVSYPLPQLEDILKDTYGVIVYQEQVMKIASELANYSLGEADLLRRAMGKKKAEEMAKQRERFLAGAHENKIDAKKAEGIFDLMAKFAEYGFNKSHSAAYALVSYYTAYLKAHYPVEFMASVLTHDMTNTDKIQVYLSDCKEHGIEVIFPDINKSYPHFHVTEDKKILYGLAAIKGVGDAAISSIVETRNELKTFKDLFHFCQWVDTRKVNKKVIEALIKCGSFDSLDSDRASLIANIDEALDWGGSKQGERAIGQGNMFDLLPEEKSRPELRRVKSIREKEKLRFEKEALGFYLTGHPLDSYEAQIKKLTSHNTKNLGDLENKSVVKLCGIISALKQIKTKKGKDMAFANFEDLAGTIEVIIFPSTFEKFQMILKGDEPLLVTGKIDANDEGVKVLAEEISNIDAVTQKQTSSIHFRIEKHLADEKTLKRLKELIHAFPGETPSFLHLYERSQAETVLSLPPDCEVAITEELIENVESLFGADSVYLN